MKKLSVIIEAMVMSAIVATQEALFAILKPGRPKWQFELRHIGPLAG